MVDQDAFEEQTFGRYRLLSKLGEGGMAEVFKAKSFGVEGFEKIVVIKRILPRLARYKSFVDMFIREAKVVVRLSHANVVQVFDLGRVDGVSPEEPPSYYMAMEYVAGMDLATLLERCKAAGIRPPPGLAIYIAAEVAKGLDHAHRRCDERNVPLGIVHRDISPQNILLSWEGEVKVTDFGIAKARDSLEDTLEDSRVRLIKGKYSYMSPEQARGDDLDQRSDLFSLGTVLYEVLSGANPFRAAEPLETLRRVREAEFPPLSLVASELSPELTELVARAMAPLPIHRFKDAAHLHEALLTHAYQTSLRFGASDLAAFLQRIRTTPAAPRSLPQEVTPVHVRTPSPNLILDEPGHQEGDLVQLREVTVLCLVVRRRGGGTFDTIPREILERATVAFQRAGGRLLSQTEPSEVLAIFGLDVVDPRDTEYAIRAALAVLRGSEEPRVLLGVGIQVGRVRVNSAREPQLDEVDGLLSEVRTLASASSGKPLLSRGAARQVKGLFILEEQGEGFVVEGQRPAQEAYGKFLGRRKELARLGTILGNASRRQLQVVTITGVAGIGKTRMLHEIDRRLRRGNFNVGVYVAPCSPRGQEAPLSGVTAMLQVLCGVQEGDRPEKIRPVAQSLRALGLLDDEVDTVLSQLGVPELRPEGPQTLRSAFLKTLLSLAEDRVHLFAWDNAQWLDEASVALISSSLGRLASTRIALVFAGREGLENLFPGAKTLESFLLEELPEDEAVQLIATRLGISELPASLIEFCLRRAGGHPLFLEEILRDLVDHGAIVVEQGAVVHLALDQEARVPRSLRAVLASRVERLPPPEQLLLQAASALGELFESSVAITMIGSKEAPQALRELERRELVRGSSTDTFTFASPLLRDVVWEAIPEETQRQLHARAAAALEQAGAPLERVAAHLQGAGRHHEAGELWARSCQLRVGAQQFDSAVSEGLKALALLNLRSFGVEASLALLRALAAALDRVRVAPSAPPLLLSALERLLPLVSPLDAAEARIEVSRALGALSCFEEALDSLAGAPTEGLPQELHQRLHLAVTEIHFRRGDFRRCREVISHLDLDAVPPSQSQRALLLKAQTHAISGEREQAFAILSRLPPAEDLIQEAQREQLRALAHFFARDFVASAAASTRGADLARRSGLSFETALHLHNLGDVLLHLEDYPRAYAALQQSLALCEQHHADRLAQQNRMYLSYLDARQGLPGGEAQLRDAIEQAHRQGYLWDVLNGRYLLARLLEDMGLLRAAAIEFDACRALAHQSQNPLLEEECLRATERIAKVTAAS
ncbi:MAG: protein kinase [Myxococcales bacterium]|nr:protein kinase [Polyangiaceae bacterium]MDW8249659.1 protein kinase [Myxococcales bacterium]